MLYFMKQKIVFNITYEDGHYTASASGKNYAIVTDGKNFEVLKKNIQEAVSLHLGDDTGNEDSEVSLLANFRIPFPA